MTEQSDDVFQPGLSMHKIRCPECKEDYYTGIPDELNDADVVKQSVTCPSCDVTKMLKYGNSDEEDVMFTVELVGGNTEDTSSDE